MLWVVLELHVDEPLIDIRVLSERPVLLTNVTALISGFAMFGSFVLVPRFVEAPGGLPGAIAAAGRLRLRRDRDDDRPLPPARLAAHAVRRADGRPARPPRRVEVAARARHERSSPSRPSLLAALHDEPWQIVVAMAGLSIGVGFAFAAMAALITEAVEPTETGIATGINTVMRTVGAVVGAQVGAAILTATTFGGRRCRPRAPT